MRKTWVIDVCRTCGELAVYPFCEHGDAAKIESLMHSSRPLPRWTVPVQVTGIWISDTTPNSDMIRPEQPLDEPGHPEIGMDSPQSGGAFSVRPRGSHEP